MCEGYCAEVTVGALATVNSWTRGAESVPSLVRLRTVNVCGPPNSGVYVMDADPLPSTTCSGPSSKR